MTRPFIPRGVDQQGRLRPTLPQPDDDGVRRGDLEAATQIVRAALLGLALACFDAAVIGWLR